jgi:Flp pilus assembly protein TadD
MLSWFKRRQQPSAVESAPDQPERPDEQARRTYDEALECCARGDHAQAEALVRTAIDLQHDFVDAHMLLGQLCHARRAYEEAEDSFALASCFAPASGEPHFRLGLMAMDRGEFVQAEALLRKAMELEPGHARAHNAAGAAMLNLERLDAARAHFERALALDPGFVEAHSNLGYLLYRDFEEFEQGEQHIRRALELAPENVDVLTNLSMIMRDRPEEVITLADRLLTRNADLDSVRLNRGLALLKLGQFQRGWADYEARKSVRCNYVPRAMPWPEWDGSSLSGRAIYVHTEQGLGDEIMFASCLPEVIAAADHCVVECSPKLLKTFRRSFDAEVVLKPRHDAELSTAARQRVDCYSALGGLPRFLRATESAFPRHTGYLRPDAIRVDRWRQKLAALPGALKVGVAWRGGVPSTQRSMRSTSLEDWLPILAIEGADFVDLQHFESAEELARLRDRHDISVHRWNDAHDDYDETAALVSALDLVISVQTALVHLSGALGKETGAVISAAPEWRYLARGERMPWYPAVRLVRQTALRDWRGPVEAVASQLRERVRGYR